jgi:hypothetical protein
MNKSSFLAPALGATKVRYYFGHTLLCYLSQTYVQQTHLWLVHQLAIFFAYYMGDAENSAI